VQPPTSPLEAAEFGIDLLTTLAAMRPLQQQPGLQTPTGMAAGEHREFMSSMLDNIVSAYLLSLASAFQRPLIIACPEAGFKQSAHFQVLDALNEVDAIL
jgi:hypothetical protein